ncbi:hypothetical protein [Micromonospora endophytica]|uniref:Uncharacterized protein n=1 Tax=Micromonospora endophytica TaxID=515350 RepID=A0A2W2CS42_9ACTN|nr:hypothetical protein [Micromonospora endophytica]PZF90847.1 hypothetical protein C1I93_22250 [Micromonospora endophytica]RIW41818.1 hypothetical protein D3H59_24790 [Micromonospora endophytica]BCJ56866.1 hypothetical protein Jiend_02880 [Micromonospora endophytica]
MATAHPGVHGHHAIERRHLLGGHRFDDAAHLLALQRAVGNRGVGELLTAQRMFQSPAQGQGQAAGAPAPAVTLTEVEQLQAYHRNVVNRHVRALLDELIPHLQRVSTWTPAPGTGGGHTRNLGPAPTGGSQYEISYASGGRDSERIAVLVHELTHVAVNEAYDSDMLNYPVAPLPAGSTAADEGARQDERVRATNQDQINAFQAHAVRNAAELLELLPAAGFGASRMQEVANKLSGHTAQKPLHEYDAVLSHLLVWAERDDVSRTTPFYQRLTAFVAEAAGWRQAGAVNPTAAPDTLNEQRDRVMNARLAIPSPRATTTAGAGAAAAGASSTASRSIRSIRDQAKATLSKLSRRFPRGDQS